MNGRSWIALVLMLASAGTAAGARMERISGNGARGFVTVEGVRAGPFDPGMWERGGLNFVPDARCPLIEPLEGAHRNIYAPTVVAEGAGYRIYFGGWDGSESGNDRLYTLTTDREFLRFSPHQLVVDNGPFVHVNNGSAVRTGDGTVYLMATTYPDERDTNKPALFTSRDGVRFRGRDTNLPGGPPPYVPSPADRVSVEGYPNFAGADVNGMNVLYREGKTWRLFFGDFKHWGKVYRASGGDPRRFVLDGPALDEGLMVNDVKAFRAGRERYALMLLHRNGDRLLYSFSRDTARFPPTKTLFESRGPEDRYIVAVGLVTDGKRPLGVLYGAGAVPTLDRNRIFARWLQKRVAFEGAGGDPATEGRSEGPDRFRFPLSGAARGRFVVYEEDGTTVRYRGPEVTARAGEVWRYRE